MTILQNVPARNGVNNVSEAIFGNGNIIPHSWYHNLLCPCGKSNTTAITILSELVFLHRYKRAAEFQLNFSYFAHKFNFDLSQAKDAVIRLEKASLLKRVFRTVIIRDIRFTNEMFLVLNIENVLKLNDQDHIKKFTLREGKEESGSHKISSDKKIKKNLEEESRSTGSNFVLNNFFVKKSPSPRSSSVTRHGFASFYLLTRSEVDELQKLCGREFNDNLINRLVLRLESKYPGYGFYTKKLFMKYMAKALAHEKRQAVNINNEDFRFKPYSKTQNQTLQVKREATKPLNTTTLWGRIRSSLIATYGEAIDKSWFSGLEIIEDSCSRSLILKGVSFLTDYIQTNYSHVIERLCREENYNLKFC